MARFHFVEDYERVVDQLVRDHPIDEAMSIAVGGNFEIVGTVEAEILKYAGLRDGHSLVDFACGSGRLAVALSGRGLKIDYLGLDVVEALLAYARTRCPAGYKFVRNQSLTLPVESSSVDYFSAFSVFTHLLHTESFIYLREMARSLRLGGKIVMSFLEFAEVAHWQVFEHSVHGKATDTLPHLNEFIERSQLKIWSNKLGFSDIEFVSGQESRWAEHPLGQSIAILTK
ncbi:class I SAM-dependent methyltransferase [uncultured Enterovirga sp.]|uniref:class I SAM-dependent methyltransferase n=1 Tax=uncultured Enterovirga sp. TaxID=2026352 RepID=UPI0035CAC4A7